MRTCEIKIIVTEDKVGGILLDLEGRVLGMAVGKIVEVPHDKNNPDRKKRKGKKTPKVKKKKAKAGRKAPAVRVERARNKILAHLHDTFADYDKLRSIGTHEGLPVGVTRSVVAGLVKSGKIGKRTNGQYMLHKAGG